MAEQLSVRLFPHGAAYIIALNELESRNADGLSILKKSPGRRNKQNGSGSMFRRIKVTAMLEAITLTTLMLVASNMATPLPASAFDQAVNTSTNAVLNRSILE
ncbi:MAG: hypothetical protein ABSC17_01905 [Thermacetogeniaceae bacterium]